MLVGTSRQRLAPDPIYEAYVADAGITGNDSFDIVGNYCCGSVPPSHTITSSTSPYLNSLALVMCRIFNGGFSSVCGSGGRKAVAAAATYIFSYVDVYVCVCVYKVYV